MSKRQFEKRSDIFSWGCPDRVPHSCHTLCKALWLQTMLQEDLSTVQIKLHDISKCSAIDLTWDNQFKSHFLLTVCLTILMGMVQPFWATLRAILEAATNISWPGQLTQGNSGVREYLFTPVLNLWTPQADKHRWLNGHEFEQAPEDGEGQGSLAYCRGHKE